MKQILNLLKSSLTDELEKYESALSNSDLIQSSVGKSAFSKARQKIKWIFFYHLCFTVVSFYYSNFKIKKWNGYRLLSVDGSEHNLPSSTELLEHFGSHHVNSIGTEIPNARTSLLYDPLNNITIDAKMESFKVGEQTMLFEHLDVMGKGDLLTADPNYGHFHILKKLILKEVDYCIRMSVCSSFMKDFIASDSEDEILEWHPSIGTKKTCFNHNVDSSPIKIRLVKIKISEKVTEIIATSLLNQEEITLDDLKELYNTRWAVEEEYKKYMQRITIEFFSSTKVNGVYQDFYANVFMVNLTNIIRNKAQEQVKKDDCKRIRKHKYQVNWTEGLRKVKSKFLLFFIKSPEVVTSILNSIFVSMCKNIERVVYGRKFKRDSRKKGSRQKAFLCYKPV